VNNAVEHGSVPAPTCRDVDRHRASFAKFTDTIARATCTATGDSRTCSITAGARGLDLEPALDDEALLTSSVTSATRGAFRPSLETTPGARVAICDWGRVHSSAGAFTRIVEADVDSGLEILASRVRLRTRAAAGEGTSKERAEQILGSSHSSTATHAAHATHTAEAAKATRPSERVPPHLLESVGVETRLLRGGSVFVVRGPLLVILQGLSNMYVSKVCRVAASSVHRRRLVSPGTSREHSCLD
jgi:hypothetical protein